MAIHFASFGTSWSSLPFGAKVRLGVTALAGLLILALVLSLSAALFLVLAPILLVSGLIGGFFMRRRMRAAGFPDPRGPDPRGQRPGDSRTIEAQYVVIEPERNDTDPGRGEPGRRG
jgi:hypothetical protein